MAALRSSAMSDRFEIRLLPIRNHFESACEVLLQSLGTIYGYGIPLIGIGIQYAVWSRFSIRHCVLVACFILCLSELWAHQMNREYFFSCGNYDGLCFLLYCVRILQLLLVFPYMLVQTLGILLFDLFPENKEIKFPKKSGANLLSFRVVTRGLFPDLIKSNLKKNKAILRNIGLDNFIFEIVTGHDLGLEDDKHVREIVVPTEYSTSRGSLFKARKLQYCLEPHINQLQKEDWIIHLDEETLLTKTSVVGILNFIQSGKHSFGQGLVTHANEDVVNWITTLSDLGGRVGQDLGGLRLAANLQNSIGFWKGSFIVARAGAEMEISFDFTTEQSIAEDNVFGITLARKGYTFGFVEGDMWEMSPFSVMDLIRQRSRWVKGLILLFLYTPDANLLGLARYFLYRIGTLLTIPDMVIHFFFPLYLPPFILFCIVFTHSGNILMFIASAVKSFSVDRFGYMNVCFLYMCTVLIIPIAALLESCGTLYGLVTWKDIDFVVVNKQTSG